MRNISRLLNLFLVLIALAAVGFILARAELIPGQYNPLAPLDLAAPPSFLTGAKLWAISGDRAACLTALRHAGVAVREMPERSEPSRCQRSGTVGLSKLYQAGLSETEMNCAVALRLYLLERHDMQSLARRHFGAGVSRLHHFGSYSCRTIRDSSRMSEHATANAFDLAGVRLTDGRSISLKQGWNSPGPSANFLRAVRARACLLFNMVLSPDYNADHADHLHMDMGWFVGCH